MRSRIEARQGMPPFKVAEVAALLGVSRGLVLSWINRQVAPLPAIRPKGQGMFLVDAGALLEFLRLVEIER